MDASESIRRGKIVSGLQADMVPGPGNLLQVRCISGPGLPPGKGLSAGANTFKELPGSAGTFPAMIETFTIGLLVGLTGALAPGPTLVATIDASARGGWSMGPRITLGHAAVESAVMLLVIAGLGTITNTGSFGSIIAVAGGAALIFFGILTIHESRFARFGEGSAPGGSAPFMAGALTSAANPYFWLWWLTVGSALLITAYEKAPLLPVAFILGHWTADFGWYTLVSTSVHQGRKVMDQRTYTLVLAACGIFLIVFGLVYLASAARGVSFS